MPRTMLRVVMYLVAVVGYRCAAQPEPVVIDVDPADTSSLVNVDHKVPPFGCIQFTVPPQKLENVLRFRNPEMINFNGTVLFSQNQRTGVVGGMQQPMCWVDQENENAAVSSSIKYCRNCRVLVGGQTWENSCWDTDDVALIYEVFNPSGEEGIYRFDLLEMIISPEKWSCYSPYSFMPYKNERCDSTVLPDCWAPGNGSGGIRVGYSGTNIMTFPCECRCNYGWSGPNCDVPPGCDSIDLSAATTCGGAPCEGINPTHQAILVKESVFGGMDPFPTAAKEEHFDGATAGGTPLMGTPCDAAHYLDVTVMYSCSKKGAQSTLQGQLCLQSPTDVPTPAPLTNSPPVSTTCDTIDLSLACSSAPCEGVDPTYLTSILNDGQFGDLAGMTAVTEAVFTSGNVSGGSLCTAGYGFTTDPVVFTCPAGDGDAAVSGQLCVAQPPEASSAPDTASPASTATDAPDTAQPAQTDVPNVPREPPPPSEDEEGSDGFLLGLIIGLSVACVCGIWLLVMCWLRMRAKDKELPPLMPPEPEPEPEPAPPVQPKAYVPVQEVPKEEPEPVEEPPKEVSESSESPPPTPPPEEPLMIGKEIVGDKRQSVASVASPLVPPPSSPPVSGRSVRGANTTQYQGSIRGRSGEHVPFTSSNPVASSRRGSGAPRSIAGTSPTTPMSPPTGYPNRRHSSQRPSG